MKNVRIPSSGSTTIVQVSPGDRLAFTFPEDKAEYVRDGAHLIITAEEGGGIVLENFFVAGEGGELPVLLMTDGSEVSGGAFLTSINPEFDITTAAGPSPSSAKSGGVGSYDDGAGDLLGGIDRFGSLGTDFWSRETSVPEQVDGTGLDSSSAGGTGGDNPGGSPDSSHYSARAVLYKTESGASDEVRFRLLDANNNPVEASAAPSFTITNDNSYFSVPVRNADGTMTAALTAEGLAALAAAGDGNLYEYMTITVDGREYRMQIVVNQTGDFTSADENTDSSHGNFSGHEWHFEGDGTGSGERYGDKGHNEVWFEKDAEEEAAFSGSFTGYGGNDTIRIENLNDDGIGMGEGAQIHTGTGQDTVTAKGGFAGMFGAQIYTGAGTDSVAAEGGVAGMFEGAQIDTGTGLDGVIVVGGVAGMFELGGNLTSITNAEAVAVSGGQAGMAVLGTGSVNSVTNAETVVMRGDTDAGMRSAAGGVNAISRVGGSVSVFGKDLGMVTGQGRESKNIIEYVKGGVFVSAEDGDNPFATAMWADGWESDELSTTTANIIRYVDGNVHIKVEADARNLARTMVFQDGGTNEISSVKGSVILEAINTDGTASAMSSFGGEGSNTIKDVGVDVILRVDGQVATPGMGSIIGTPGSNGMGGGSTISDVGRDVLLEISGSAMGANGAEEVTKITGVGGNVTLKNTALQPYSGSMNAHNRGTGEISNVKGNVSMDGRMNASVANLEGRPGGINRISGIGDFDDPSALGGNVSLAAMHADGSGSRNTIMDVTRNVDLGSIPAGGGEALNNSGMYGTHYRGSFTTYNTISGIGGTVNMSAKSFGMFAYGYGLSGKGLDTVVENRITDVKGDVNIFVNSSAPRESGILAGEGSGMWAEDAGSINTISGVGGTVTVSARQGDKTTYGMAAKEAGVNEISAVAGGVDVSAKSVGAYDAYGMYAQSLGSENWIKDVDGTVTVSAESASETAYGLKAADGGQNFIDNSVSDSALTLIIKVSKPADYALHAATTGSANVITGSSLNDRIDITGKVLGNNVINTDAGNDRLTLDGKIESATALALDMGDGYDTLVLKADDLSAFNTNYADWLNGLLNAGTHNIESIQVDGFTSLTDVPDWLKSACTAGGIDLTLYGGEVPGSGAGAYTYAADHSYLVTVDGNEADGQAVVLNNGHDRIELTGSVGRGATDTTLDTANGNDYAQAKDADLGTGFTLDMGDGDDMLALSGSVSIASGATLSGGTGCDVLSLGGLSSLNGTNVSGGAGLTLSTLGDILDGFEVLDMTGAGGSGLVVDIDSLLPLGIGSNELPSFSSSDFDVNNLHNANVLLIKGDADDTVAFSGPDWVGTGKTVTADGTDYTVYSNHADEYILVQQLVAITG